MRHVSHGRRGGHRFAIGVVGIGTRDTAFVEPLLMAAASRIAREV
ncbi:hypothetical protein P0W64_08440 [Tsukamurella sp. 8F]|nr:MULTISPECIES: hypothetical protein [unclassified Tsukamurella]MDF0530553.1 hypothetical protein [Tsukamurella sp. 8J]MDF0586797.1 hypothetical protein [Tsukamurella sp. 8F]